MDSYSATANNIDQLIINAGSIGQPRGKGQGYILLDIINNKLFKARFEKIKLDFKNSISVIRKTKLTKKTKKNNRLFYI